MADVTAKRFDELEAYKGPFQKGQQMLYAGKSLGVTAWGMNILKMPPNWQDYIEHDHVKDGEEEVYIALEGSGRLYVEGHSWALAPGVLIRVGPSTKRKIVPGAEGMTLLALGAVPPKS
jgi:uncharacterized cupin superfamily protein